MTGRADQDRGVKGDSQVFSDGVHASIPVELQHSLSKQKQNSLIQERPWEGKDDTR